MANTNAPRKSRRRASTPQEAATATDSAAAASTPQPSTGESDNGVASSPTYDEIAQAAYQRYLDRGAADGADLDDWIAAERALKQGR